MSRARRRGRFIRRVALFGAAVAVTGAAHARFDTRSSQERLEQGSFGVPSTAQAQLATLGFDAALADYYWLRALALVGGERSAVERHGPRIAALIDLVTSVDPWVDHPYRFAAVWLTATPELVREGSRLMVRGISYHPLDWRNRYHLGFNHFFYLEEDLAAADVLETAVGLEGAPQYLAPLVARLRANRGGLEIAAAFLAKAADDTSDEFARAEYLKALDEIEVERRARFLDAAREEYWKRNGADITRVEDLLAGPRPVLNALPRAHMHLQGFGWILEPSTRQIVSSFYKSRYELHVNAADRARKKRWRKLLESEAQAKAEDGA